MSKIGLSLRRAFKISTTTPPAEHELSSEEKPASCEETSELELQESNAQLEQFQQQLQEKQRQLKKQQAQLKQQQRQVKLQKKLLTKQIRPGKARKSKRPLACLSAELKHRLIELLRRSGPNYELWLREWYFGAVSLRAAEFLLLSSKENQPGAFLISEGVGDRKKEFVLSVLTAERGEGAEDSAPSVPIVKHYRVRAYYGYSISTWVSFASLQNLINYYSSQQDDVVQLGRPCAMPQSRDYAKL
jgi:SH2 domain